MKHKADIYSATSTNCLSVESNSTPSVVICIMSVASASTAMKNDSNPETKGKLKETVKKVISSQKADGIVIRQLKHLYSTRLLPIEKQYLFAKLHYPEILDSEMSAKPTVLLVGQYSTGKTSFIKNLLGMDYPDIHIGPEVLL